MTMRIALFGQAPVAVDCLDRLHAAGHEVVGVFAPPDGSRPDPLAARAKELGLTVVQRRFFRKKSGEPIPKALEEYRALDAELNVLASLTSFLPVEITDAPRHKSICFHPSLLPAYRGGNAMQWQIIDGALEVGVSIFVPDEGVDTGPLVVQKGGVKLDATDTTGTLFFKKLYPLGVEALVEAVDLIDRDEAELQVQSENGASFQGLVDDSVAAISLAKSAAEIDRLVRGCDPQPGAFLQRTGQTIRLYDVKLVNTESTGPVGSVVRIDEAGLLLQLDGGQLLVGRVRADAGKESSADYAKRSGLTAGDLLTDA